MRHKATTPRARLTAKLDAEFSKVLRERVGKCEICGKPGIEPHHVVKRRFTWGRWNPDAVLWVCRGCHTIIDANPPQFMDWLEVKYPEKSRCYQERHLHDGLKLLEM